LCLALDDGQEMVAGQGAHLACKRRAAIGEQQFRFAIAAGIKQDIATRRVTGMIFKTYAELEIAKRHQHRLAAPARMDGLVAKRQQCLEDVAGERGLFQLQPRNKIEIADRYPQPFY
jgi:ABC-type arginine transport system ATPase subunit